MFFMLVAMRISMKAPDDTTSLVSEVESGMKEDSGSASACRGLLRQAEYWFGKKIEKTIIVGNNFSFIKMC